MHYRYMPKGISKRWITVSFYQYYMPDGIDYLQNYIVVAAA